MKVKSIAVFLLVFAVAFSGVLFTQQVKAEDLDDIRVGITASDGTKYCLEGYAYGIYDTTSVGAGWSYDRSTNTLVLTDFSGESIYVERYFGKSDEITIVLNGNNFLTRDAFEESAYALALRSDGLKSTIKGSGMLTVEQKNDIYHCAIGAHDIFLEDSVTVNAISVGNSAFIGHSTYIAKGAKLYVKAELQPYIGANGGSTKDEIYGILTSECISDDKASRQAFYYTSYACVLGDNRAIYAGESADKLAKINLLTSEGEKYMPYGTEYNYKYVAVLPAESEQTSVIIPGGNNSVNNPAIDKPIINPVSFSDIPSGAWYEANVRAVAEAGIVNGKGIGTFAPNDNVTLAETVKLAAAVHAKLSGSNNDFSDGNPWYQPYLDYLNQAGGFPNLSGYNFNAPANRELFAKVMSGVIDTMSVSEKSRNTVEDGAIPDVPDADVNAAIYALYRAGIVVGSDTLGTYNPGSNIKRSEVAAIIHRFIDAEQRKSITLTAHTH